MLFQRVDRKFLWGRICFLATQFNNGTISKLIIFKNLGKGTRHWYFNSIASPLLEYTHTQNVNFVSWLPDNPVPPGWNCWEKQAISLWCHRSLRMLLECVDNNPTHGIQCTDRGRCENLPERQPSGFRWFRIMIWLPVMCLSTLSSDRGLKELAGEGDVQMKQWPGVLRYFL